MNAPRHGGRARGSVLIEFVVVLPVLLLLTMAAVDWGWYFTLRANLTHAVREGARIGSVAPEAAIADARLAVENYLQPLGRPVTNLVIGLEDGPSGYQMISVAFENYPAGSITGFGLSQVPETISTHAHMRLEVQPAP